MKESLLALLLFVLLFNVSGQIKTSEVSVEPTNDLTTIDVPAKNGGEQILRLSVSDAPSDYLSFANWTQNDQQFMPSIRGYRATDNRQALYLAGFIEPGNDNGTKPVMTFDSRSTSGDVITRPIFGWDNYGSRKMTLTADGQLGIGIENPVTKLHVEAPSLTGVEEILRLSISDAASDYLSFANWTQNDQQFMPSIRGYRATDNRQALYLAGFIEPGNDNGTNPVMTFDSRSTSGGVITRPIFGWDNYGSRKMTLTADGKLGIGTETPEGTLHVETPGVSGGERLMRLTVSDAPDDYLQFNNATGANNQLIPTVKGYHISDNRSALFVSGEVAPGNDAGDEPVVVFDARVTGGPITTRPVFAWKSHTLTRMTMLANGNVGIARANPNHRLDVNGNINASEYYNSGNLVDWPDYVFEDAYELSSLEEVEKHIKKHGHLENIPSEKEVAEHGYRMGDMDTKLLEKVEELTLYLIDMNKKLEEQNKRIEALEKENKKLKNRNKS